MKKILFVLILLLIVCSGIFPDTLPSSSTAYLEIDLTKSSYIIGFSSSPMNSNTITPEGTPSFNLKNTLTADGSLQGVLEQGYIYVFWKIASNTSIDLKLSTTALKMNDENTISWTLVYKNKFGEASVVSNIGSGSSNVTLHHHDPGFDDWGCIGFSAETTGDSFEKPAGRYSAVMTLTMEVT